MNPALQGYLAAVSESLTAPSDTARAAEELRAVADLIDGSTELTLALDDGALPVSARRAVLDELVSGKVSDEVARLVHQAVTVVRPADLTASLHGLATRMAEAADRAARGPGPPQDEAPLGRTAARQRVWGYAAAVFESLSVEDLEQVEDELFRFARTVEANRALRTAFGDRELPTAERQGMAADLLAGKVTDATLRLVGYAVRGGRARDFVPTLDSLVEAAATARGWRVAKVRSAEPVADDQQQELSRALGTLTGQPVELQVSIDPALLAGAVVEVGDLLVDGTVRHRLVQLSDQLAHAAPGTATRFTNAREEPSR